MNENLAIIWNFILQLRAQVPGPIRSISIAVEDDTEFDNSDDTMYNVVIGSRGSASFTADEAKKASEETIKRCVLSLLGVDSADPQVIQEKINQINFELADVQSVKSGLTSKETELAALLSKLTDVSTVEIKP